MGKRGRPRKIVPEKTEEEKIAEAIKQDLKSANAELSEDDVRAMLDDISKEEKTTKEESEKRAERKRVENLIKNRHAVCFTAEESSTLDLYPEGKPVRQTEGSACVDLRADTRVVLKPGMVRLVSTGLKVEIRRDCCLMVYPRSSLSIKKSIMMANSVGIIDSDYRGIVMVPLINIGKEIQILERGERIAQAMLIRGIGESWEYTTHLAETERGEGGMGSTGTM